MLEAAERRNEAAEHPEDALWRTSAEAVAQRAAYSGPAITHQTRALVHVAGRRTLARCHDGKRAHEDDNHSHKRDCALRDELPPLLGAHPRQEHVFGLPEHRWAEK